jgi:osmotically-inducible protein OsmY
MAGCVAGVLAVVVLLGVGAARAGTASSSSRIPDADIARALELDLLIDDGVSAQLVDVDVDEGVVTLSGSVDSLLGKRRAKAIAQRVRGVRAVINRIDVMPSARDDERIHEDVMEALLHDPAADSYELGVEVVDGVVTLSGLVDSWAEKKLSEDVVAGVHGVRRIDNDVRISYDTDRPDSEIRAEVRRRLESDVWVDGPPISVEVDDGTVTLSGTVGSAAEKQRARIDAWVAGVREVDDGRLEVDPLYRDATEREERFAPRSDEEIAKAIEDAFVYDPRVHAFDLDVEVDDGVVTLTGEVDNLEAERAAKQDARNTTGVWRVRSFLRVRPDERPGDEELRRDVLAAMRRDPYIERKEIAASVVNGKVYLYGEVDTQFEYRQAGNVASAVDGVVEVVNRVDVDSIWPAKNDWSIHEDVESQLWWSPFVDADEVDISVEEGVVVLTGTVDTWQERSAAAKNAYDGGAKTVVNNLTVRYGPVYYLP